MSYSLFFCRYHRIPTWPPLLDLYTCCSCSIIRCPCSKIHCPRFMILCPRSMIHCPHSMIHCPHSTIYCPHLHRTESPVSCIVYIQRLVPDCRRLLLIRVTLLLAFLLLADHLHARNNARGATLLLLLIVVIYHVPFLSSQA